MFPPGPDFSIVHISFGVVASPPCGVLVIVLSPVPSPSGSLHIPLCIVVTVPSGFISTHSHKVSVSES